MPLPRNLSALQNAICICLITAMTACSASSEPSCKSSTAEEAVRQGIEQELRAMLIYGESVQVTKVAGSPIERLQFGVICQSVVDISGVDVSKINSGDKDGPSKIVQPFQITMGFRVDKVDGELVTRWNANSLFQVVGVAASLKAAEEAGVAIPGHSFGTPGR